MAITTTQLIISPVIRQYFIDPSTLLPVVGKIYFYQLDKITPKNVYRQTGDIDNSFEVAANPIDLDTAGAIPFVLYLYPYDETDDTVEELYYIEVRRDDTSLVFALDDFPQNFSESSGGGNASTQLINRFPSYGFDIPVFFNYYTELNDQTVPNPEDFSTNENNVITPAVGWIWQMENFTFSSFYYSFTEIPFGTLDGNPIYLLNLKNAINGANQTYNYFGAVLCLGSELEDQTINLQLFAQDLSIIPVTSLSVGLVVNEGSISIVGSIPLDTTLSLRTLQFTMPDISTFLQNDNDYVYLVIQLPFDQTFDLKFSGTYCYLGDAQTIARLPINTGTSQATQYWSSNDTDFIRPNNDYLQSAQPISARKGQLSYLDRVGSIYIGASGNLTEAAKNSAVALTYKTLIRGQVIQDTLTDRFLDDPFSKTISRLAGNSFVVTPVTTTSFEVATNAKVASYSPWVSSIPASVLIVANGGTTDHGITAVAGPNPQDVDITFKEDYDANTGYSMFIYDPLSRNDTDNIYNVESITGNPPQYQTVINNVVGNNYTFPHDEQRFLFDVNPGMTITNLATGSPTTQAQCRVTFLDSTFTTTTIKTSSDNSQFVRLPQSGDTVVKYYTNYLSYLDVTTSPVVPDIPPGFYPYMTNLPPFCIQFHVDNDGAQITGTKFPVLTVNLDSAQLGDGTYLATQLLAAINNIGNYTVTVLATPTNGQTLQASTTDTPFVIIFYDTSQPKPSNPFPGVVPIFLEYDAVESLDSITSKLEDIFLKDIGGIPSPFDLVDTNDVGLPTLPFSLQYFMNI